MKDADIAVLGASSLVDGTPLWQGVIPVANDNDQVESLGESDVFQALGVTSMPFPKDDNGFAESVILRNVGGRDIVHIGARDTRTAAIVGKLAQGDTVVHSTGPQQAAQLQLKEKKRQAVLASKDTRGRTMALVLDGKNDKFQIACLGAMIEIDRSGDITLCNAEGAGIKIQGGKIFILGELSLPGMTPGFALMQGAPAGQAPGPAAVLLTPVMGVGK